MATASSRRFCRTWSKIPNLYNDYNFWLENYDTANQDGPFVARVPTFLCPDNPDIENVAAMHDAFPGQSLELRQSPLRRQLGWRPRFSGRGGQRLPPNAATGQPWPVG